jgi:tRNA (mo5U34)-methyltransferase
MRLPELRGKSVLDIGAWDGFFSFEAERHGAARVVALDHYIWSMDVPAMIRYWEQCKRDGTTPQQYDTIPGMWRPSELPGKKGFDTARALLGSKVESRVGDLMEMDLGELGTFDVVFYLGVLYHVHNPFEALKRLARVTRELAVIETEAIVTPGYEGSALCEFYETNELHGDVNNWWAPTEKALIGMARAAGFRKVEPVVAPPKPPRAKPPSFWQRLRGTAPAAKPQILHYRAVAHAWK